MFDTLVSVLLFHLLMPDTSVHPDSRAQTRTIRALVQEHEMPVILRWNLL